MRRTPQENGGVRDSQPLLALALPKIPFWEDLAHFLVELVERTDSDLGCCTLRERTTDAGKVGRFVGHRA